MECDVVVVDTGCIYDHPKLANKNISGIYIHKNQSGKFEINDSDFVDDVGHGTAICGTIFSHEPTIKIFVIKIFDEKLYVDENLLIFALDYI